MRVDEHGMYDQEPGERSGRCKPCGLLYAWAVARGRELFRAHCPECERRLSQTCASLLSAGNAKLAEARPRFQKGWVKR